MTKTTSPRIRASRLLVSCVLAAASTPSLAVEAFNADYTANYMGMQASARMSLAPAGGDRWKYSMVIRNAMANLSQNTVFEDRAGKWRPISNNDSASLLVKKTNRSATYDWAKGEARWTGDVKGDRAGPVKLQAGDLDAMLVNLAITRDVNAGKKSMSYRMVDDGRIKPMTYQVAGTEAVTVQGKSQQATKVSRTDGDKQTIVWVVDGVPAPVRILQRKNGKDEMDLKLKALN